MTGGKRMLIVEDEPAISLALEDIVESLGWVAVGFAPRLQLGIALAQSCAPDMAILDVNLHGELSYPIADILADNDVPYVFATGYGDTEHPARHRGAFTLTKPYSTEDVRAAIAWAMGDR